MSKIHVVAPDRSGLGTQIFLDGQEVKECIGFDLRIRPDEVITAKVSAFAEESLDLTIDAQTTLEICGLPGFVVEETPITGGGRRIRVVPE